MTHAGSSGHIPIISQLHSAVLLGLDVAVTVFDGINVSVDASLGLTSTVLYCSRSTVSITFLLSNPSSSYKTSHCSEATAPRL